MATSGFGGGRHRQLDQAVLIGRSAWPTLAVDLETLSAYLSERLGDEREAPAEILADLYLAWACVAGVSGAIAAFCASHVIMVEALARPFNPSPAFADEVRQRLAETLFVTARGGVPKIAQYSGEGPLRRWVAVAIKRIALRLSKRGPQEQAQDLDLLANQLGEGGDGELMLLKAQFKAAFTAAVTEALRRLPARHRLILKLNLLRGISMDAIARMHRVSQPTISRWLQAARKNIVDDTRRLMAESLKLPEDEFNSVFRLVCSQADVSFSRLLDDTLD